MALANEVSRMSWSRLLDSWSRSLVLLDAAAFSSLDQLPITRSQKVSKDGVLWCFMVFYGVFVFFVPCSEALDSKL